LTVQADVIGQSRYHSILRRPFPIGGPL